MHHALPLSIIPEEDAKFDEWFYSNYIQLFCSAGDSYDPSDINFQSMFVWDHKYPHLDLISVTRDQVRIFSNNLFDFIATSISNGYYFHTYVDEYYVPLEHYQTSHVTRDILIYGIDLEEQRLHVLGYNSTKKVGSEVITFQQFLEGYEAAPKEIDWAHGINIYKRKFDKEYKFDIVHVMNILESYLESKSIHLRGVTNPLNWYYGLDTIRAISRILSNDEPKPYLSNVPGTILCEHKEIMKNRMIFIRNKNLVADRGALDKLIDEYDEVVKEYGVLKALVLKYNRKAQQSLITQMVNKLEAVIELEYTILSNLLALLRNNIAELSA